MANLSDDLLECPADRIRDIVSEMTIVDRLHCRGE